MRFAKCGFAEDEHCGEWALRRIGFAENGVCGVRIICFCKDEFLRRLVCGIDFSGCGSGV